MTKYEDHEIAALFPLMSESELSDLAQDILQNGQREDIVVYQGKILDGRNRYRACLLADVEPRVKSYIGTDPIRDVLSWNLHRRHLTTSQRAMIATAVLPMLEEQARERKVEAVKKSNAARAENSEVANLRSMDTPEEKHLASADAATMLNVSPRSVQTAKKVQQAAPELAEKVKAGEVSLNAAAQEVKKAEQAQKRETRKAHDFKVLAVHPDWTADYAALRRLEFPDTGESFHAFAVVPNERLNDGLYLFHAWFGVYPSCVFSVARENVVQVEGIKVDTDLVFYAPIGEPEWTGKGTPSTREEASLSIFWKAVKRWTDGPRMCVGMDADGFKTYTKES